MLDIRMPIGLLFGLVGLLLVVHGLTTPAEMYGVSLGINLNLLWGAAMACFGAGMGLAMSIWPDRPDADARTGDDGDVRERVVPASGPRHGD